MKKRTIYIIAGFLFLIPGINGFKKAGLTSSSSLILFSVSLNMHIFLLLATVLITSLSALNAEEWKPVNAPRLIPTDMFEIDPSLEVTVWATSPMLYNPTNMDIDHEGRVWVTEGVNYRGRNGTRPEGDRIVVLQDTDSDGKCDSSHTFVQEKGLIAPMGVAVFDNVVYLSQPPDLIAYTDVNRNLIFEPEIDKREVILTGFNAINHDHSLHLSLIHI